MNNKGFTLAELLIVVAIIAVLVAISIPVFTAQLEKAREATDAANIRSAYAQNQVDLISGATALSITEVDATQTKANWQSANDAPTMDIGGKDVGASVIGWTFTMNTDKTDVVIAPKTGSN